MLSKSRFLAGLQCHLRLWYQCFERELIPEVPPSQQAIFDAGHEVGNLATRLYTGGVLIDAPYYQHKEAVQSTFDAMQDPDVKAIYEAAFIFDGVRIRRKVGGFYLGEVGWCRRSDSNRHVPEGHWILSPARLPISPLRHQW